MTIALDALGDTYMRIPEARYKSRFDEPVAAIGLGILDSLPHNSAVVTLLAVCGSTHRESYLKIRMVGTVSALIAPVTAMPSIRWLARSRMMRAQVASEMHLRTILYCSRQHHCS